MEMKGYAWCGIILLTIAVGGLLIFDSASYSGNSGLIKPSIVYLALLSIGLFYENNKIKLAEISRRPWVGKLGVIFLAYVALGLIVLEVISLWGQNGIFLPPLFMAALAIGLFCGSRAINRS